MRALREVLWAAQTRDTFAEHARRGTVVVVPIASTEQHGEHLPLDVDCRTVQHVALEAARRLEDVPVLVTPLLPLGFSIHHRMYGGGTLSLRVETLLHVVQDLCESLTSQGFERVLLLSGHGGNRDTLSAAAQELRHRQDCAIRAACWFDLVPEALEAVREGPTVGIGHAGEMETSAMLALAPEMVRRDALRLVQGITDDPSLGGAEKGERLLSAAVEALTAYLRGMAAAPGHGLPGIETTPIP
ncbi:MAG: creatininase family protein [Anaerolineae bacterium]